MSGLCCKISLPASKSIAQRLMLIDAFLCPNSTETSALSLNVEQQCDDIKVLYHALKAVRSSNVVWLGESGTAMRLLTAFLATKPGVRKLCGTSKLLSRPMQPLIDALAQLGVEVSLPIVEPTNAVSVTSSLSVSPSLTEVSLLGANHPFSSFTIRTNGIVGDEVTVNPSQSSQFVSALMLIAPMLENGLKINLSAPPVSMPYIRMTEALMRCCGAELTIADNRIDIANKRYTTTSAAVEACWSSASYFYEMLLAYRVLTAAKHGDRCDERGKSNHQPLNAAIAFDNLSLPSLQGDSIVAEWFAQLGICTEICSDDTIYIYVSPAAADVDSAVVLDFVHHPDLLPTMVVSCCMLGRPFKFTGIENLVYKESNRIAVVVKAMESCGYHIEVAPNELSYQPLKRTHVAAVEIDCCNDHRIAMSMAPLTLLMPGLTLNNTKCVNKSFPTFWQLFQQVKSTLFG